MRLMRRLAGLLALAVSTAVLVAWFVPAFGQSNSMADQGLQILQGLSGEQRDALGSQFGGASNGGVSQSNTGSRQLQSNETQQNLLLQQQRDALQDTQKQRADMQRLSPFLQGEDWVVITIDWYPLPAVNPVPQPPQTTTGNQGLQGAGGPGQQQQNLLGNLAPSLGGASQAALAQQAAASAALSAGAGGAQNAQQQTPTQSPGQQGTPASQLQSVTAGGYAVLPPNCSGQSNCDPSLPTQPELSDDEKKQRQTLIDLIRTKNPYQLSREGTLWLPGFAPIQLGGLTEQLATLRLGVEPALKDLFIRVTKLPLTKQGTTALKPFGYDLFDRQISSFAPSTDVPVPANYIIGAGDQLNLELYGNKNQQLHLTVGRDGRISVPELGPVYVAGQLFTSAKQEVESQVERHMIGVHANLTMGDTRSVRVFVLGDAKYPGSYTISGLGSMTSALFAAGGIQPIGSLRKIELRRHGQLVGKLDLYDMLIRGDTTDDARLLPDDVIFIPPIGPTVTVDGEVHRPAIYEVRNETSINQVIQLAGGLTAEADTAKVAVTRIDGTLHRVVLQVDLSSAGRAEAVRDGDSLRVSRLRPTLDAGVVVQGYLYTPGAYAYHDGMRLTDVLRSVDDLKPNADLHYVLVRRESPPDRRISVLSADLVAALQAPDSNANIPLMARDRITVFDLQSSRDRVIEPLLQDLKLQSNIQRPENVVKIDGRANVPGSYPYENGMTVRDLVRAGGGLSDAAYSGTAELTRYQIVDGESRKTELIQVDLAAALRGDTAANMQLQPFDSLSIKEIQAWTDRETITLKGEVKFPGRYSVKPGETLKSVMLRAGGLTQYAFPRGGVFTRKELRDREQKELDMLAVRMQDDIAFVALQGTVANQAGAASALQVGQSLLAQLRQTKAVGRLVINLPSMLAAPIGSPYDVVLRDGDQLIVPKTQQEVTVIGEVQTVTSHLYRAGLSRDDYISMSGGMTARADKGRIYVVRADGSVVANEGSRWFAGSGLQIQPGDTIVVPLNAEHMPPLPLWQAVSQILYNVAIAVLAVHEF
jgi:polysaccharide export outer membrane protein